MDIIEEDDDLSQDDFEELGTVLFVRALASMLKPDEGIILHHEGHGYVVYSNSEYETISVIGDDDYLEIEHGTLMWMYYEGSEAPEPEFDEVIIGRDEKLH